MTNKKCTKHQPTTCDLAGPIIAKCVKCGAYLKQQRYYDKKTKNYKYRLIKVRK